MNYLLKKLAQKAAEKASKVDMTEVINQQTADDIVHLIKGLLF